MYGLDDYTRVKHVMRRHRTSSEPGVSWVPHRHLSNAGSG